MRASLFWLTDHRSDATFNDLAEGPMAANQVHAGAEILRYAGTDTALIVPYGMPDYVVPLFTEAHRAR